MHTTPPLSQEVWERTPAEAQTYIRALEARVVALEATVQQRFHGKVGEINAQMIRMGFKEVHKI